MDDRMWDLETLLRRIEKGLNRHSCSCGRAYPEPHLQHCPVAMAQAIERCLDGDGVVELEELEQLSV